MLKGVKRGWVRGRQARDVWAQLEAASAKEVGGAEPRRVRLGPGGANEGHAGNSIRTAKYNVATFVPIFLWTMFSRVAYLYFLCQVSARALTPCKP